MENRFRKFAVVAGLLVAVLALSGCVIFLGGDGLPLSHSPLARGVWHGDRFENEWTGMYLYMPLGFHSLLPQSSERRVAPMVTEEVRGVEDFFIANEDFTVIIAMHMLDVSRGHLRGYSAEDYLNGVWGELQENPDRIRNRGDFETAYVAGRQYVLMRSDFADAETPEYIRFQDSYAHRWVNTMLIFIVTYDYGYEELAAAVLEAIGHGWQLTQN